MTQCNGTQGLICVENDCPRDVLSSISVNSTLPRSAGPPCWQLVHNDVPSTQLGEDLTGTLDAEMIAVCELDHGTHWAIAFRSLENGMI